MKELHLICTCGNEYVAKSIKSNLCPSCRKKSKHEYQTIYNRNYKQEGRHLNENKRSYRRTVLKNKPREYADEFINYCRKNWDKIEGCLNCICPECIQQTENDTVLPWEDEGFYAKESNIDNSLERYLG
jgi:hypothetical protein